MGFFNSKRSSEDDAKRQSAERIARMQAEAQAADRAAAGRDALAVQKEQDRGARTREMIQASSGENRQFYNTPLQKGQESVDVIRGTDRTEERFKQMAGGEWVPVPKTSVMELKQNTDQQRVDQGYKLGADRNAIDRFQAQNTATYQTGQNEIGKKNAETNEQYRRDMANAANTKANAYEAKTEAGAAPKAISYIDQDGNKGTAIWDDETKQYEPFQGRKHEETPEDLIGRLLKRKFDPSKTMTGYQR